jgi:dihydroflavonol-4-reductase
MRYAVTGATGFVGGELAAQLLRAGHVVTALARDPARAARLTEAGATLVTGDLDDRDALDRLCAGIDGLFHVAGWYKVGSRDPAQGWRVNVVGTRNVLEAARRAAVPRVVYTSTLAVNSDTRGEVVDETFRFTGRHISVYDETKARAHDVAATMAAGGAPIVIVMPGAVYGPGDTSQTGALLAQAIDGHRPLVPVGGRLCWGYVEDIARGHLLAMQRGDDGESYLLAGEPASLARALRIAAELAQTKPPVVLPSALVRAAAAVAARLGSLPLPADYAAETLRASLATYLGSPAKAEEALGWTSRPLRQGLAELVVRRTREAPRSD